MGSAPGKPYSMLSVWPPEVEKKKAGITCLL